MTWAIVIMVGVFVLLRAVQGANRSTLRDALERAAAAAYDPAQDDADDPDFDDDAPLAPALVRESEPRSEPALSPCAVTNPRTRAIIRSINGKGLCSPR